MHMVHHDDPRRSECRGHRSEAPGHIDITQARHHGRTSHRRRGALRIDAARKRPRRPYGRVICQQDQHIGVDAYDHRRCGLGGPQARLDLAGALL